MNKKLAFFIILTCTVFSLNCEDYNYYDNITYENDDDFYNDVYYDDESDDYDGNPIEKSPTVNGKTSKIDFKEIKKHIDDEKQSFQEENSNDYYIEEDYHSENQHYNEDDFAEEESDDFFLDNGWKKHSMIAFNLGYSANEITASSLNLDFSYGILPFFFCGYDLNLYFPEKSKLYSIVPSGTLIMSNIFKLGIDFNLSYIDIYCSLGIGVNYITVFDKAPNNKVYTNVPEDIYDFIININTGVVVPIYRHFGITANYSLTSIPGLEYKDSKGNTKIPNYGNINIGIAVLF